MIKVGIVGGTGYTGVELLRLLAQHPQVEVRAITSRKDAGTPVARMFPSLRRQRRRSRSSSPSARALERCDVVFFATPHGVAMGRRASSWTPACGSSTSPPTSGSRTSPSWSAGTRCKHAAPTPRRGGVRAAAKSTASAIRSARIVGNPGCYPTAVQLGFLPLVEAGVVDTEHLIADCKSGVSGAGRKAELDLHASPRRPTTSRPTA